MFERSVLEDVGHAGFGSLTLEPDDVGGTLDALAALSDADFDAVLDAYAPATDLSEPEYESDVLLDAREIDIVRDAQSAAGRIDLATVAINRAAEVMETYGDYLEVEHDAELMTLWDRQQYRWRGLPYEARVDLAGLARGMADSDADPDVIAAMPDVVLAQYVNDLADQGDYSGLSDVELANRLDEQDPPGDDEMLARWEALHGA
jgi:hypothetical protein